MSLFFRLLALAVVAEAGYTLRGRSLGSVPTDAGGDGEHESREIPTTPFEVAGEVDFASMEEDAGAVSSNLGSLLGRVQTLQHKISDANTTEAISSLRSNQRHEVQVEGLRQSLSSTQKQNTQRKVRVEELEAELNSTEVGSHAAAEKASRLQRALNAEKAAEAAEAARAERLERDLNRTEEQFRAGHEHEVSLERDLGEEKVAKEDNIARAEHLETDLRRANSEGKMKDSQIASLEKDLGKERKIGGKLAADVAESKGEVETQKRATASEAKRATRLDQDLNRTEMLLRSDRVEGQRQERDAASRLLAAREQRSEEWERALNQSQAAVASSHDFAAKLTKDLLAARQKAADLEFNLTGARSSHNVKYEMLRTELQTERNREIELQRQLDKVRMDEAAKTKAAEAAAGDSQKFAAKLTDDLLAARQRAEDLEFNLTGSQPQGSSAATVKLEKLRTELDIERNRESSLQKQLEKAQQALTVKAMSATAPGGDGSSTSTEEASALENGKLKQEVTNLRQDVQLRDTALAAARAKQFQLQQALQDAQAQASAAMTEVHSADSAAHIAVQPAAPAPVAVPMSPMSAPQQQVRPQVQPLPASAPPASSGNFMNILKELGSEISEPSVSTGTEAPVAQTPSVVDAAAMAAARASALAAKFMATPPAALPAALQPVPQLPAPVVAPIVPTLPQAAPAVAPPVVPTLTVQPAPAGSAAPPVLANTAPAGVTGSLAGLGDSSQDSAFINKLQSLAAKLSGQEAPAAPAAPPPPQAVPATPAPISAPPAPFSPSPPKAGGDAAAQLAAAQAQFAAIEHGGAKQGTPTSFSSSQAATTEDDSDSDNGEEKDPTNEASDDSSDTGGVVADAETDADDDAALLALESE